MKLPSTICDLRYAIWKKSPDAAFANCQSPIANRRSQLGLGTPNSELRTPNSETGMALVITLILLSVTLIMAVAFLAISRRERNAVTTTTDTASARLAADAALANAEAQIVANIFASSNAAAYNFGLLVSTNYPPFGDTNTPDVLTNLFVLPRAPVYLSNLVTHAMENRFYLDLNRNGVDDPNGWVTSMDNNGNPILDASNNVVTNLVVGDPEWIGVLDHPDVPHGPNNLFVARYAFIAVPVGNTLDINAIHNQTLNRSLDTTPNSDGFFRNQGVGTWEINLAAFLADLNTNEWDSTVGGVYQYQQPIGSGNNGLAFSDAFALLTNRYAGIYNSLAAVNALYPGGVTAFRNNIDGYSDGPLQTTFADINESLQSVLLPWAGAYNTNQYFTPEELFNTAETSTFGSDLLDANTNHFGGTTNSTYDRYTFYRMLAELGSDTTPDSGKINLNYSNAVVQTDLNGIATNIVIVPNAETNFVPWAATNFFTAAADRLLRLYTTNWFETNPSNYLATFYGVATNYYYINSFGYTVTNDPSGLGLTNIPFYGMTNQIPAFGIANIPVLANGQFVYTPAVNRLLQLAANIYDSVYYTSNYVTPGGFAYMPNVFRPIFYVTNELNLSGVVVTNVYIRGYTEVTSAYEADAPLSVPWNIENPAVLGSLPMGLHVGSSAINVFGVPMIVGAEKGLPNFNELYMESIFQLTRKLMVTRQSTNVPSPPPTWSNPFWSYYMMYNLSLANQFGVECWNSYRSNYTRAIDIYVTNYLVMTLTNDENFGFTTNLIAGSILQFPNITNAVWTGYTNSISPLLSPGSFQVPLQTNFAAVAVSRYVFNSGTPYLSTNLNVWYETVPTGFGQFPQPHWWLTMNNNLQVVMVDDATGRLIDYVQLSGPNSFRDLTAEIQNEWGPGSGNNTKYNDQWDTNQLNGLPNGFGNQYAVSQGNGIPYPYVAKYWSTDKQTAYDQMNAFLAFTMGANAFTLNYSGYIPHPGEIAAAEMTNSIQMAYTPTATVVQDFEWQANDPLVHYVSSDLNDPAESGFFTVTNWPGNLGKLNQRYQPWGGNPNLPSEDTYPYTLAIKDPLVYCSDDWNFPTNKLPTVGWLGRVHRGTPWQTVYLKATNILNNANGLTIWTERTGNVNPFDVTNTAPKQDRLLFDLFTTAFDDDATRGTLSVNQPHLAAWSALFSGVMVLSNNASDTVLQPTYQLGAGSISNYTAFPISPAGPGTNSAMWQLWNGITQSRASVLNVDGVAGAFEHEGDILFVPQLTEQSPFLHLSNYVNNVWVSDTIQKEKGISDEMYEWLPQQVMSLLREGTPRYVIYCYGQTLKPAPNSLVTTGGNTFGMCTNYQVVAESAGRAVVRVEGAGTSTPHIVVESFNPLPPD